MSEDINTEAAAGRRITEHLAYGKALLDTADAVSPGPDRIRQLLAAGRVVGLARDLSFQFDLVMVDPVMDIYARYILACRTAKSDGSQALPMGDRH